MHTQHSTRIVALVADPAGRQGESVERHLLADGRWHVRVLVGDALAPGAHALRAAGAEVLEGDAGDPECLRFALERTDALFFTTSTQAPEDGELETGLVINVPSFINSGDVVRVSTETGEYLGRA